MKIKYYVLFDNGNVWECHADNLVDLCGKLIRDGVEEIVLSITKAP